MKILSCLLFSILIFFLFDLSLNASPFNSDYYHIDLVSKDATETKSQSINDVKLQSFHDILYRIIIDEDKKKLKKSIQNLTNYDFFIKNILIDNELITKNNMIAPKTEII